MSEITESYSYGVAQKTEGKYLRLKILLIALYIIIPVGAIIMMFFETWMVFFGALLAVSDALVAFFTWRFVSFDYEYEVTSGKLTFTIVRNAFNHRIKKPQTEFIIKDCVAIAPYNNPAFPECQKKYDEFGAVKVWNALSSKKAEDAYYALYTDKDGQKCAFLFQATGDMLKRCRWYNKDNTVVTQTRI